MLSPAKTSAPVDDETKAFARAIRLLQVRARSAQEMRERLLRYGYSEKLTKNVCQRLSDCLLLDDANFTESYIRGKIASGWGRVRIEKELAKKGIDVSQINGYPDLYFEDSAEFERAMTALKRHRSTAKNVRESQFRYLIAKGFSASVTNKAVRAYCGATD